MRHVLLDSLGSASPLPAPTGPGLVDGQGRAITYLRLSITDRCDLRCTYCMPERVRFVPKPDLLSFEELDRLVEAFIARGVRKLRVTGGEPLVRRDAMALLERFARHLGHGLGELTLTTNGTQLARHADALAGIGIRRINVSLDSLDRAMFARLSRRDMLPDVLAGLAAAKAAGLKVKINTVALASANRAEIGDLIAWAHGEGHDISLIETMPLGEVETDRSADFLSLADVRADLAARFTLTPVSHSTGGPSRYVRVAETGGLVGFITPLSHNFCADCNRVRVDCRGRLYTCLGHEDGADLRPALRAGEPIDALIDAALRVKPVRHDFDAARLATPAQARTMSHTGG